MFTINLRLLHYYLCYLTFVHYASIAAANLLLDYTAQRLKLTNFGSVQLLDEYCNEVRVDDNAGTLSYNPPEVSILCVIRNWMWLTCSI